MEKKKEIFLIPYSHLDTQWRWEYPTTINKYIKNTLDESIEMFRKYPDHHFNFTGAIRYQMMKEYFPEEFEEVKKLVGEERWHLAGTCLDETDALVPASESMIRNILYGDKWQMKEFGRSSRDYMIPDCFGFPGNMPTLLAHCGIRGFSSQKLTWGSSVGIPFEIGMWKGPDGSEIVSALNPCRYDAHLELPLYINPSRLARLTRLGKKNGIWKSFQYYGVGDIGGAPTEGSIRRALASIRHYARKAKGLVVRQGAADQFFNEVTDEEKRRMDRYEGDFLLTNHSAGTITSAAIMKRWNRKNEQLAFAAEAAALSAMVNAGLPYPEEKIESAWRLVIGNQMHDILPGTSTPTAYEFSHNDEVIALKTWSHILDDSAEAIAPLVKGEGNILFFNPLVQSRREPVDLEMDLSEDPVEGRVVLESGTGETYPGELKKVGERRYALSFIPELPPSSWTRFSLRSPGLKDQVAVDDPVTLERNGAGFVLENGRYRVSLSMKGALSSVFCKEADRELLGKPLAYEFQKERPMKFPAWNMDWRDRKKAPFCRIEEGSEIHVLEHSSLRVTLQVVTNYQSSQFFREISLSAGSDLVEITERINWRETGCTFKVAFTAALEEPEFTCNWETSRIKRDVNHKKIFEVPSRQWADLSGKKHGFSIIEDSKYGWDRPEANTIRMTLLYTPALRYTNGFWDQKTHDWGEHTIRYGIYGHGGDWRGTDRVARAFNQPVRSFLVEGKDGADKADIGSLLQLSSHQFGVMAVKKSESDDAILVRLYEREGRYGRAALSFSHAVSRVVEVNGLEEPIEAVGFKGNSFEVAMGASSVKAFVVTLKDTAGITEIHSTPIPLEWDDRLIGGNGEDSGALFPEEITPDRISAGTVEFYLNRGDGDNAMSFRGQTIKLPEGYNSLSLLAGAERDTHVSFKWLDSQGNLLSEENRTIPAMTGYEGQWDRRIWKREPKHHLKHRRDYAWLNKCTGVEPGFINRDRLEWFASHTHDRGADKTYRYGYLHNVTMAIPDGAASLLLPERDKTWILAAAASKRPVMVKSIQKLSDKFDF
ncbi:glycoside hydrolase family 38 C-terminal domain-containing protein [Spirochaeta isovalerica]|uniref:Alpha-mannosidase n=1 Tax=Spirochaeta isovalerica TaxID=150 RepID=A0A841R498_9SPIO|nr:glycoside hydrolase family 38 C-terminal domain-containing protein [Spirochaeta isovalerica]MBB6479934.1 alpha-mannosidase [Spirochaeta isovalerica]